MGSVTVNGSGTWLDYYVNPDQVPMVEAEAIFELLGNDLVTERSPAGIRLTVNGHVVEASMDGVRSTRVTFDGGEASGMNLLVYCVNDTVYISTDVLAMFGYACQVDGNTLMVQATGN